MRTKYAETGNLTRVVLRALITAVITMTVGTIGGAAMLEKGVITESNLGYISTAILLISAVVVSLFASVGAEKKRLCIIVSISVMFSLLLLVSVVFKKLDINGVVRTLLLISGGSILPYLVSRHKNNIKNNDFKKWKK